MIGGPDGLTAMGAETACMGLNDLPPRPDAPPRPGTQRPGEPGVTKIEREHFLLHVPFHWVAVPGDRPLEFEFHNQTLPEQLIVTVLLAREPLPPSQVEQVAGELAEMRLSALREVSGGRAVHSTPQVQTGAGQAEVRCVGMDESRQVRYGFVVRVAPAKVVTVAITRHFVEEVGHPFDLYCATISDLLQVKNPTL